jgi:hypothetical protein
MKPIASVNILDKFENEIYFLYIKKIGAEWCLCDSTSTMFKSDSQDDCINIMIRLYSPWKTYKLY